MCSTNSEILALISTNLALNFYLGVFHFAICGPASLTHVLLTAILIDDDTSENNSVASKEFLLSEGRHPLFTKIRCVTTKYFTSGENNTVLDLSEK